MGKLYGIGVGPGDPELLTLKAYKILNQADVIFCPEKKKGAGSFAFDIIKEHIKDSKAQIVNLEYPMHYTEGSPKVIKAPVLSPFKYSEIRRPFSSHIFFSSSPL